MPTTQQDPTASLQGRSHKASFTNFLWHAAHRWSPLTVEVSAVCNFCQHTSALLSVKCLRAGQAPLLGTIWDSDGSSTCTRSKKDAPHFLT